MKSFLRTHLWILAVLAVLAVGFVVILGPGLGMPAAIPLVMVVATALVSIATYRWLARLRRQSPEPKWLLPASVAVGLAVVMLVAQAIPYGRDHSNPPITAEPAWDTPTTRELTVRACFACHSNEVEYPWYASVAPLSWAVQMHVDDGRSAVNYSEWDQGGDNEADESAETVIEGEMPPSYFTAFGLHPEARLTGAERIDLISGLRATFGEEDSDGGDHDEDEDD